MLKAVIFDLDGTLGDTLPLCLAAFQRAIAPLSGKEVTAEEILATFGPSEEGTIKTLIPERYDEGLRAYWHWYDKLHDMCPAPFDGVADLLSFLRERGVRLAMVTGKARESADISMNRFGLSPFFDDFGYGWKHGPRKTEAINEVLEKQGVRPDEAAYVGDAPSDVTSARAAGVPVYSAAWADSSDEGVREQLRALSPDRIFESVASLRAFLEERLAAER